jgi:D-aminoacyl-tRNA deacylase
MKAIIIYSKEDIAGTNISKFLKDYFEVVSVTSSLLYCEKEVESILKDEYVIFASRHKSETEKPCFTAHTPGNFGKAEFGGIDGEVCIACPNEMKTVLMNIVHHTEFEKARSAGMEVYMECTHHGPYIKNPCFFVEIGSSEKEWKNDFYAKIVADAIISHSFKPYRWPIAFGIGGGHYCPKFTKYELSGAKEGNAFAFAHVVPNYILDELKEEVLERAIARSKDPIGICLIDWKGTKKGQRDRIIKFFESKGIKWKRV